LPLQRVKRNVILASQSLKIDNLILFNAVLDSYGYFQLRKDILEGAKQFVLVKANFTILFDH